MKKRLMAITCCALCLTAVSAQEKLFSGAKVKSPIVNTDGTVTFTLPAKSLAYVGADGKWILEEGDFTLKVGNLTQPLECTKTKVWDTPNI